LSTKDEQIEWRRSKVVEMRAKGMSQIEIARELQVSKQSISSDVQYLRSQAKESIREYVTEHLPEQYQVCLTALDAIIKRAFEILESSPYNREKLQAMELFKDTHLVKLELLSNATTIDSALHYIRNKQQEQQQEQNKRLSLDSDSNSATAGNEYDNNNNISKDGQLTEASGRQTVF
jgi:transcriptional regulator with XRE-family HTH domain